MLAGFISLHRGTHLLMDVDTNYRLRSVWARFTVGGAPPATRQIIISPSSHELKEWGQRLIYMPHDLKAHFCALDTVVTANRGKLHWGGSCLDCHLPFTGRIRESYPNLRHFPWDRRYRYMLDHVKWSENRDAVFRYARMAARFAARCAEFGASTVLVPSVGLAIAPWLLAHHRLAVLATDISPTALGVLSNPLGWPRLFSPAAYDRWDIDMSAAYHGGNPDPLAGLPNLADPAVVSALRSRIAFVVADWAHLPLADASVDALFATNALPRHAEPLQRTVVQEWIRVLRPGGSAFIAQHNFFNGSAERQLHAAGWVPADLLAGEHPPPPATAVQFRYSSG